MQKAVYAQRRRAALETVRPALEAIQRDRVIDGFAAVVMDKGYAATTIGDIARVARVSKTTIYEHFSDKEAIYLELHASAAAAEQSALRDSVNRTAAASAWRERIGDLVHARLEVIASNPPFLAQVAIEPQVPTQRAREVRAEAGRRTARICVGLSEEIARTTPEVAPLASQLVIAGLAAGVAVVGTAAVRGPGAVRALETVLVDFWIRLFRAP
jgi:AcrR family transcriptional regulator